MDSSGKHMYLHHCEAALYKSSSAWKAASFTNQYKKKMLVIPIQALMNCTRWSLWVPSNLEWMWYCEKWTENRSPKDTGTTGKLSWNKDNFLHLLQLQTWGSAEDESQKWIFILWRISLFMLRNMAALRQRSWSQNRHPLVTSLLCIFDVLQPK